MSTVRVSVLSNGLRVVTDTMAAVETVSVGAWVEAGARHETTAFNGVSHLLEHMAFKGTRRRDARAIAEEIESVGGTINAYTSREHTAYYAKVLKEDLPLAVDILADILQHAQLDAEELERERAVVIQEIHQAHDTPDDIVFDHFQETAYPDQPLGRPVLGTLDRISSLRRQTVVDYMRTSYSAPRMVLSAAGRVDHETLVRLAEEAFGGLAGDGLGEVAAARYRGGECRMEKALEQVHVVLGFDGVPYGDPAYYDAAVMSSLLGGGMSSRLFQKVREERGLVYSIYSFTSSYMDGGLVGIYAGTGGEEVAEVLPLVLDEIQGLCDRVTEEEVARARAQMRAGILMSLESTGSRCEHLARQMIVFGRPLGIDEILDKIERVEAESILATARRVFASPPTLAGVGPLANMIDVGEAGRRLA